MSVNEIVELLYQRVCGSCEDVIAVIECMIDDNELDEQEFRFNELEILSRLDDQMFNCEVCGWNCESSEMSEDETRLLCSSCKEME